MSIDPGWYPDRMDPARQRYWDGARWSDDTRPMPAAGGEAEGAAPAPPPPPEVTTPLPDAGATIATPPPGPIADLGPPAAPPASASTPWPAPAAPAPPPVVGLGKPPPPPSGPPAVAGAVGVADAAGPPPVPPATTQAQAQPLPPPPPPSRRSGGRGVLLGVLAIVAALVLGGGAIAFAVSSTSDDPDDQAVDSSVPDTSVPDPSEVSPTEGIEEPGADPTTVPVTCDEADTEPEVRRIWQDESGTHVVVVLHTTCEVDQVLDAPDAQFGLFLGPDHLVTGSFDLSAAPLAVPAAGTSGELELVFDAEADSDPMVRSRVFLPTSEASAQPLGFDLRYVVVCEPGDGGAGSTLADSRSGANLDAAAFVGGGGPDPSTPEGVAGDDAAALQELERIHAEQAGQRAAMTDLWVPQVSAKRLGDDATVDIITGQTVVHTPSVFLDRFHAWEARYPGQAVLFRGRDAYSICGERQSPDCLDLWIVAVDQPQGDEFAVFDGWCEAEGLNYLNGVRITDSTQLHCIARRFSAGPPSENSYAG